MRLPSVLAVYPPKPTFTPCFFPNATAKIGSERRTVVLAELLGSEASASAAALTLAISARASAADSGASCRRVRSATICVAVMVLSCPCPARAGHGWLG